MNEYNPNAADRARAETIRRQYVERKENKMDRLRKLDSKVKKPGMVLSYIVGILGSLVMGGGMAMIMVSSVVTPLGLILGIAGMLLALVAYPIYSGVTGKRKKQYAQEIFTLTESIMAE